LDLPPVLLLIADWRGRIEAEGFAVNPLPLREPPRLTLPA
jgi:hypothetical protein